MTVRYPTDKQVSQQIAREEALAHAQRVAMIRRNPRFRRYLSRLHETRLYIMFRTCVRLLWRVSLGRYVYVKVDNEHTNPRAEAAAMRFVTQHTQIPVPYVWLQVQIFDVYYTFMTRINGKCLQDIWPNLSHSDRELIVRQLRNFMQQLRSIPPPPRSNICSILGGRVCCYRLFDRELSGPFRDEQHLNAQLRNGRSIDTFPPEVAVSHNKIHPLVLTHNDFFPRNIMVSGTNVTAVLDWECAGWFPSHWEYCKSVNWGKSWRPELLEWVPWVEQIIEPFYEEAKADEVLLKMIFQPTQHIP